MSFYKMERGWMDSDVWAKEPYTEREAWEWLIGEAQFKDRNINIDNKPYLLKRGQVRSSIRFMADKFQWGTGRVQRFLDKLKNWGMVDTAVDTGQTIITICNYNKYQGINRKTDTPMDTPVDTAATHQRHTNGYKLEEVQEGKEGKEVISTIEIKLDSSVGALCEKTQSDAETPKPKKNLKQQIKKPDDVSETTWKDFLEHRKAKKAPVTETVLTAFRREAGKIGWTLEQAMAESCARGWQGFKAEWIENDRSKNGTGNRSFGDRASAEQNLIAGFRQAYSGQP